MNLFTSFAARFGQFHCRATAANSHERASRIKSIVLAALLCGVALAFTACSSDNPDNPNPATTMSLTVNGEHYDIALPTDGAVDLITLNTEFDAEFDIDNANEFERLTIGGNEVKGGHLALPIAKIAKDKQIEIAYTTGGKRGTVTLNTLHSGIPEIIASGHAVIEGDFYLSFIYQRLIMKYDNSGNILFYRYAPTPNVGTLDELGYWDFKKHNFGGKTYYSYHAPDDRYADRAFTGYDPGMRVLLDDHYKPVKTIQALQSLDGYLAEGEPIDGHDFYFFTPDHYILSAYVKREFDGNDCIVSYLQEVKDGEVVFDWWCTEHPEMMDWRSDLFDTSYDLVHFNSMQVLPDGNLLCSFRHLCSVVKIDRTSETREKGLGSIIWRIAGDNQPEEKWSFYGQHYVRLHPNGTLTIFDNGNGHDPQHTRALRLTIDPLTGEVQGGGDLLSPGGGYFTQACGALMLFDEGFTVGWGWSTEEGNNTRLVTEHNASGRLIFSLHRSADDCSPASPNPSYRCVKY